jgi:hypothetical protein
MAFNNTPTPDLSRFSIGEIVDLSGVSTFYNAGSSKWLRSGVATASSNLTTSTKTNLAAAGTSAVQTVLTQSALSLSYNGFGFFATYPIARISASNISVVPSYYLGTTAVGVGVMTAAGLQSVSTGQTSNRTSTTTEGTNAVVASNNTTIFSYCFTSATALNVAYTTNGTTWTAGGTATNLPVFASDATTVAHASASSGATYTVAATIGWKRTFPGGSAGQFAVFWCGARFLVLGPGTGQTNYVASLSTDGIAFGGNNTTDVLGATARPVTNNIQFYRNGNNCYLNVGTGHRYSTDGGITWANSTFSAAPNAADYYLQYNQTDPAKLVIVNGTGQTAAYYTADSGATWSASRTLPMSGQNGGLYYKGTTLVISDANTLYYVSTNDGVTWAIPTLPIGVLSTNLKFFADANRFYAGVANQAQLLTSSDAVTWTIVTLTQNFSMGAIITVGGYGILPFDSNTVVLLGYNETTGANQTFFTLDGGVTWTAAQYTSSNTGGQWNVGNAFLTPDAGGVGFAFGSGGITSANNTNVLKTDIVGGGAFYRTGASAITPIRTGSFAYVRVG